MMDWLLVLRTPVAVGGLLVCIGLEALWRFRQPLEPLWRHYTLNVGLAAFNALAVRVVFGGLFIYVAAQAHSANLGLLGLWDGPAWAEIALTVLFYDALTYVMHVLYHFLPVMWRLHQVHHSDRDYDVTTASRFHPIEILLSTSVQILLVTALGANPVGVALFQILLLLQAQLQHANVALPDALERKICLLFVTPNMHRVHHSVIPGETNSNFSTILSVWDRIGGTFVRRVDQAAIDIGLNAYRTAAQTGLGPMLTMPFKPLPPQE